LPELLDFAAAELLVVLPLALLLLLGMPVVLGGWL
jgi:hypothetical protein